MSLSLPIGARLFDVDPGRTDSTSAGEGTADVGIQRFRGQAGHAGVGSQEGDG